MDAYRIRAGTEPERSQEQTGTEPDASPEPGRMQAELKPKQSLQKKIKKKIIPMRTDWLASGNAAAYASPMPK